MNLIKIITKLLLVFALASSLFSASSRYDEYQGCCCCDYDISIVCECLIESEEVQLVPDELIISKSIQSLKINQSSDYNHLPLLSKRNRLISKLDFAQSIYYDLKYAIRSQVLLI